MENCFQLDNIQTTETLIASIKSSREEMLKSHKYLEYHLDLHDHMKDDPDTDLSHLALTVVQQFSQYELLCNILSLPLNDDLKELYNWSNDMLIEELDIIILEDD